MDKLNDKPNSALVIRAKELDHEHRAVKSKILEDLDKLKKLEREFQKINEILLSRNV